MQNKKRSLTEGSVIKSIIAISVPIILANILQTAYQLTDTFWVGRLGASAVAAVSISFPLVFLIISLGGGLAMAGTILVAQYKGKGDKTATDHVATQTILMVFIVSALLSIVGYIVAPMITRLMGVEQSVYWDSVSYMKVSFLGIIFVFGYAIFESLMRGVGEVKLPVYIVLGTVLLNLILDPLFIFGYGPIPASGVSGAAWATFGTQGIATFIGMAVLLAGKYDLHIKIKNMKPDIPLIKKIFRLGLPSSLEQSSRALGITVMVFLVASFGTTALAAYGIGGRVFSFVIIPTIGLAVATSTLVGQNMGAGKVERAAEVNRISSIIGFLILTLTGIIIFIFAPHISGFFIPGETTAIASSTLFIRLMALSFGFVSIQQVIGGTFKGSGNTFPSMVLTVVSFWVIQFPLAYILSHHTPLNEVGIWISMPASNILGALIAYIWYAKGNWKKTRLTEQIKVVGKISTEVTADEGAM